MQSKFLNKSKKYVTIILIFSEHSFCRVFNFLVVNIFLKLINCIAKAMIYC